MIAHVMDVLPAPLAVPARTIRGIFNVSYLVLFHYSLLVIFLPSAVTGMSWEVW